MDTPKHIVADIINNEGETTYFIKNKNTDGYSRVGIKKVVDRETIEVFPIKIVKKSGKNLGKNLGKNETLFGDNVYVSGIFTEEPTQTVKYSELYEMDDVENMLGGKTRHSRKRRASNLNKSRRRRGRKSRRNRSRR